MKTSPSLGERALFSGLLAVLAFSILTRWSLEAWQESSIQTGVFSLAICWALRCALFGIPWPTKWIQLPFLLACCWGLLQLATGRTVYRFATWSAVLTWTTLTFAFGVAYLSLRNPILSHRFRMFGIYFGGFLSIWAILQLVSGDGKLLWLFTIEGMERPIGPFGSYDHYATFMMLLLAMALWEALTTPRAIVFGGMAACMYASIIAAGSRAGSGLATLELIAMLILGLRSRHPALDRRSRKGGMLVVGLAICAVMIVGFTFLLNRLQEPTLGLEFRLDVGASTVAMIRAHPWIGFGLGTWTTVYPGYASFDTVEFMNAAHNDWLQWAAEGGIPFALLMLVVAIRALWLALKEPWSLGIAFALLHCAIDFPLQRLNIFVWIVVILAAAEMSWSRAQARAVTEGG